MPLILRKLLLFFAFSWCFFQALAESKQPVSDDSTRIRRLEAFRFDLQQIVDQYPGLCVGVALVRSDKAPWIEEIGACPRHSKEGATGQTIFRIGSISKMFAGLAILKLQEQGKLSLDDKVADILPELVFDNPWEETDPLKIVHLLEHTTGWDEMHVTEMTHNQFPPVSLGKALDFRPRTRTSRWVPGSRFAYSNVGYGVVAAVVEKIAGTSYEQFIANQIWSPLQMSHSTFFKDDLFSQWAAPTYNWQMEEVPYKHELYRSASAMNSSVADMAGLLQLLVNRGKIESLVLFQDTSIARMETPKSTLGAKAGLALGYGLGNFTSISNGFTYHGHQGAIDGGLSELAYLPEQGTGHVILINANHGRAMQELATLVREFEQNGLSTTPPDTVPYEGTISVQEGYYLAINPRSQNRFYQDVFFNIEKIAMSEGRLTKTWILPGPTTSYTPISATTFTDDNSRKISLVIAEDPIAGTVLYTDQLVLKHISGVRVISQFLLLGLWIALMGYGFLAWGYSTIAFFFNKKAFRNALRVCGIPGVTSLFFCMIVLFQRTGLKNADILFSSPTLLSVGLMLTSILFAVGAITSVVMLWRWKGVKVKRMVFYPMFLLGCLHLIAAIYLMYFGMIPWMTWV
ncbi:serine hydrolase [Algoriphagus sp. A40]|uniref:serine hydrolase domain-containing protein n=1 Tax=Algoriphagus sp. A40 TaxID=1945863 RepID=UPI000984F49F|nr:serine hydrolase domain-containing protein [Algoriphagus sp. A40]OOG77158.1 hypothetical protein B0E43_06050 [Algoriphagus sp. A40]